MPEVLLFNKPYGVLSQFTDDQGRATLAKHIPLKGYYPAGRLDADSEGLLVLTNDGALQARIAHPKFKLPKTYWVQLEGEITEEALTLLRNGVVLKDGKTRPAQVNRIQPPDIWPRTPPIRDRKEIPTSWIELVITEGKNRQVRRMTAHAGFPTLRLVRAAISSWKLGTLPPGEYRIDQIHLPKSSTNKTHSRQRRSHGAQRAQRKESKS